MFALNKLIPRALCFLKAELYDSAKENNLPKISLILNSTVYPAVITTTVQMYYGAQKNTSLMFPEAEQNKL